MHRSLIAGGAFFRTEDTNQDNDYQRHHQLATYLATHSASTTQS